MNNKPIAYIPDTGLKTLQDGGWCVANAVKMGDSDIPLYNRPHPDNLGLALSIIDQQKIEIEALKSVVYWLKENRPEVWEDIQKWRKQ